MALSRLRTRRTKLADFHVRVRLASVSVTLITVASARPDGCSSLAFFPAASWQRGPHAVAYDPLRGLFRPLLPTRVAPRQSNAALVPHAYFAETVAGRQH